MVNVFTNAYFRVLENMENIDDDCDKLEVSFVAIKDKSVAIRLVTKICEF